MFAAVLICASFALHVTAQVEGGPPHSSNPDCNVQNTTDHVYKTCTFVCDGDEALSLSGEEPCELLMPSENPSDFVPKAMDRSDTGAKRGVCENGNCVEKGNAKTLPEQVA
uniref:Putative secreted protein n=1 Tax=Amblyomma parvum TaxID=251391 RepID=A0A023G0D8_AMBPA